MASPTIWAKTKTHAGKGALIGGLAGTAVGFGTSYAIGQGFKCNANQRAQGEPCSIPTIVTVSGTVGGALVGAGIGALIGKAIPKKENMSIVPVVTHDKQSGMMGALVFTKGF